MNIDLLISEHVEPKIGNPESVIKLFDIPDDLLTKVKNELTIKYDLESEEFKTNEFVFYDTRRIVMYSTLFKTSKQLYTNKDFDYELDKIIRPLLEYVTSVIGKNYIPTLTQLATLLPNQKLKWHVDTFLYQQFSNKIHIPLFTNEESYYETFNGETLEKTHLNFGAAWNINNLDLHRSTNLGETFRTHLIIDFIKEDKLKILEGTGLNYFHHRLDFMSEKEKNQLINLKKLFEK